MRPIDADNIDFSKYSNVLKAIANTPTLEVVPISTLDEIKAEIKQLENDSRSSEEEYPSCKQCIDNTYRDIYEILDKHKADRSGEDED